MEDFEMDVDKCLQVLNGGGTILYPTDTIWGIGCDATNSEAVKKIYELKKRSGEKSLIVLVADKKEILRYVTQPDPGVFDYLKTVRKPTTIIYEGAIGLADNLVGKDGYFPAPFFSKFFRHTRRNKKECRLYCVIPAKR
jgi:L-threonylcarbamoyladenylate synthase